MSVSASVPLASPNAAPGTELVAIPGTRVEPIREERFSWSDYGGVALEAVVSIPLRDISILDLARIVPGTVFRSTHHFKDDVFLSIHNQFVANVSLEPAGSARGIRIKDFDHRAQTSIPNGPSDLRDAQTLSFSPEMERLKKLKVQISLCFGTKTFRLQEALQLMPGQLLALDCPLQDSVSLYVNGRVVARGTPMLFSDFYSVVVTAVELAAAED